MSYIWKNPDWPSYTYHVELISKKYEDYLVQKRASDIVFSIIDPGMRERMHAHSLAHEIQASLEIEGERISYDSVYSSLCQRLDINLEKKAKTDRYAESISTLALDATQNLQELSHDRIHHWHTLLFNAMAGVCESH